MAKSVLSAVNWALFGTFEEGAGGDTTSDSTRDGEGEAGGEGEMEVDA